MCMPLSQILQNCWLKVWCHRLMRFFSNLFLVLSTGASKRTSLRLVFCYQGWKHVSSVRTGRRLIGTRLANYGFGVKTLLQGTGIIHKLPKNPSLTVGFGRVIGSKWMKINTSSEHSNPISLILLSNALFLVTLTGSK